jgi:hypothetical protein
MMLKDLRWDVPVKVPVEPRTARQALLAAARWIEEHGWSPRGYEQEQDRYCVIEAVHEVTSNTRLQSAAVDLLRDHIRDFQPIGITFWNARSDEDTVIATMRAAAR